MSKTDEIAEYYDNHSMEHEINAAIESGAARWETDIEADPMVGVTVRLPKSILDAVRQTATTRGMKPTALIRQWVERAIANSDRTTTLEMSALAHVVRQSVHDELVNAKLVA